MKKMGLMLRQIIQIMIPILTLVLALVFVGISTSTIMNNFAESFEKDSFTSIDLILNADRDYYQSLDGYNRMFLFPVGSEEYEAGRQDYLGNIDDVKNRMGEIRRIANENSDLASLTMSDASASVSKKMSVFFTAFEKWEKETQTVIQKLESGSSVSSLMADIDNTTKLFGEAREELNIIGETLGLYPSLLSQQYIKSSQNTRTITYW